MYLQRTAGLHFDAIQGLNSDCAPQVARYSSAEKAVQTARTTLLAAFDAALLALPDGDERTAVYNTRKVFFQKNILKNRSNWAHSPLIQDALAAYEQAELHLVNARNTYEQYYTECCHTAARHLQTIAQYPDFQRALLFSSHSLLQQIPSFITKSPEQWGKKERHTADGLLQYATRMATKTTPLSRWATVQWVGAEAPAEFTFPWEQDAAATQRRFSKDSVGDSDKIVKVTPNVALLPAFYDVLLAIPVFRQALHVQLNPFVETESGGVFRWWYYNGSEEAVQTTAATGVLRFLAKNCLGEQSQMAFPAIVAALAEATEADMSTAQQYILDLLDTGFLEWLLPENGQSPSWCGRLYQFLGFIEGGSSVSAITEAAFLLQWLRTAARTIPFQSVTEAANTQREAMEQVTLYFERYLGTAPEIPVEQLFFEDVSAKQDAVLSAEGLSQLEHALHYLLTQPVSAVPLPVLRQKTISILQESGAMPLLELFDRLRTTVPVTDTAIANTDIRLPVGVLVQPFEEGSASFFVLNALFSGGGKLFGRWLHLFDPGVTQTLKAQNAAIEHLYGFNWYQAFNANMHPDITTRKVQLPGVSATNTACAARDLEVDLMPNRQIILRNRRDQSPIFFTDLGIEDAQSRPLLMQLALMAGQQPLSKYNWVVPAYEEIGEGIYYQARQYIGKMVVQRAHWSIEPAVWEHWLSLSESAFYYQFSQLVSALGLPKHLFFKINKRSSQYICTDSPLHIALFQKSLRQESNSKVILEEMLPVGWSREVAY